MAQKVEYRRQGNKIDVFANGTKTFTCDEVQFSQSVTRDGTGHIYQIALVTRVHPQKGLQSTIVFDGKAPREEDWFRGTLNRSFTQVPDGLTFCSSSQGFLTFSWPE